MSQITSSFSRSSLLLTGDRFLGHLRRTQQQLLDAQEQISSGLAISRPSDGPGRTLAILSIQADLEARSQVNKNQQHAITVLNNTDQALNDATDQLLEIKSLTISQLGLDATGQTRQSQVGVVDAHLQTMIDIGNRRFNDVNLFAGRESGVEEGQVFTYFPGGGIRYQGDDLPLTGDLGLDFPLGVNSNGVDAFGALSSRVAGTVDLDPQATAQTRLVDLRGAQGAGVRATIIAVTVNGTTANVELGGVQTLGDAATVISDAIATLNPAAGAVAVSGGGLGVTANGGHTITIADLGAGQAAADLGIAVTAASATVPGADLDARLTELTALSSLAAPIDLTGGLKITQGAETRTVDLSSAQTVQDLVNTIDQLGLGLRLQINDDGTGFNLRSEVSGIELSVGENAGGTTAQDLGIRSFGTGTRLSDFNHGRGIQQVAGLDDFDIELHSGAAFGVNLDGVATVSQLLSTIGTAAAGAGLTIGVPGDAGTDLNIGLAADGNGLVFEDGTAGAGDFRVVGVNGSLAATDLGIDLNAGTGGTIAGEDRATVRAEGVFTQLINLRAALANNDTSGITLAGESLENSLDTVIAARADVSVRARQVEQMQERSSELRTTEQSLLSELRDADLTQVITRFTQLQQQLEASLRVGVQGLELNLLDFLR